MNRILKRPMFKMGGSAGSGITSGLDQPRKQYNQGSPSPYERALTTTERATQDLAKFRGDQGRFMPSGLPGFLTSFGLNLLSTPPQGGLLSTAARAAQQPFQTFQAAQLQEQQRKADLAEDIFSGALASEYGLEEERVKAEAKGAGGTEFEKERRIQLLDGLYDTQIKDLESQLENAPAPTRESIQNQIDQLQKDRDNKKKSILTGEMTEEEFVKDIIIAGVKNDVFDPAKVAEKYPELADLLYDQELAEGGRAGYNFGGSAMMPEVAKAEEDQIQDLSYNELRSRLPQSISNDVVQVIANSKQALLDFANIRDQQDVDQFNQRYNVNLNIAQEG
jgi:hypothetical protein